MTKHAAPEASFRTPSESESEAAEAERLGLRRSSANAAAHADYVARSRADVHNRLTAGRDVDQLPPPVPRTDAKHVPADHDARRSDRAHMPTVRAARAT